MTTGSPSAPELLVQQRQQLAPLLDERSPADALAGYYALYHDPRRTRLFIQSGTRERIDGFLAVCQTGLDLFRPLAVLQASADEAGDVVPALLRAGLAPSRPYYLIAPQDLHAAIASTVALSETSLCHVYTLDPQQFQPVINILVRQEPAPDGKERWVVRTTEGQAAALAGINWRSPRWAEIYVNVDARLRGRGLGRSVVSACTAWLLDQRLRPLYLAAEDNRHSIALAEALGYRDTRVRLFMAQAVLA